MSLILFVELLIQFRCYRVENKYMQINVMFCYFLHLHMKLFILLRMRSQQSLFLREQNNEQVIIVH